MQHIDPENKSLRPNVKRAFGRAILLGCFTLHAAAATLEITVTHPQTVAAPDLVECRPTQATACRTSLVDALRLIQQPAWQKQLAGHYNGVRLRLAAGTYRLNKPLRLQWGQQSPSQGLPLEIVGTDKTIISGALPLSAQGLAHAERMPANARGHVWQFSLSATKKLLENPPPPRGFQLPSRPVLTEIFFHDTAMPIAAWPNQGYGRIARIAGRAASDKNTFGVEQRSVGDWLNEPDLQAFAYWFWDWAAQTYAIADINPARNALTLADAGALYGIKAGQRIRIENALSELDQPGEWYIDRAAARLYFWPPETIQTGEEPTVEISVAPSLLDISQSRDVTVRGIRFEKSRGTAITIRDSERVVIEEATIRNTGNNALAISQGTACGIRHSVIEDSGEGGVVLSGGDRPTLTPAGHFVEHSTFRRLNRLVKTYRPAILLFGVGQRVENNVISDLPHFAIQFAGNDHRIVDNEIFRVALDTSDVGAIYTGRDYTARGTLIAGNFLHDIGIDAAERKIMGVYLDDQASGITIRGNIFARVQQPVHLSGGRDNIVDGNIFYHSGPAIFLSAQGLHWNRKATLDPAGDLQKRLDAVPYRQAHYANRYPHLANIREDEIGAPKYNLARRNVVVGGAPTELRDQEARHGIRIEGTQLTGEAVFALPAPPGGRKTREDFRLKDATCCAASATE